MIAVIAAHAHVSWLHGGGVGVDIFFGISGFLITFLLIREARKYGRIDLRNFWLRRLLRLMPALIVLIVCVDIFAVVVTQLRPNAYLSQSLAASPSVLLYFSNWMIVATDSAYLGWFGPLWSLSVEEQFYFLWPLVVVLAFRTRRPLAVLAGVGGAIALGAVVLRFIVFDGTDVYRTFGTDFRVDMLLAGVLLAIAMHAGLHTVVKKFSAVAVAPAVLFLATVAVVVPEFGAAGTSEATRIYYTYGLPVVGLSTVTVIGFIVTHQTAGFTRALSWKPLEYTGRISYGMYLWHYPIIMGINAVLDVNASVTFVLALALTYSFASVSWFYVERPLSLKLHGTFKARAPIGPVSQH